MLAAILAAFVSIFIAECGDKTQLVTLSMASRYPPLQVLSGALLALFLVLSLAVGAGGFFAARIPRPVIILVSGVFFVFMGFYTLFKREQEGISGVERAGFYRTFGAVILAEMGDKTQLTALLLAASSGRPLAVLTGGMLAMAANHSLAVFLGARFISRLDPYCLRIGTAALFILLGLAMIGLR